MNLLVVSKYIFGEISHFTENVNLGLLLEIMSSVSTKNRQLEASGRRLQLKSNSILFVFGKICILIFRSMCFLVLEIRRKISG